MRACIEDAGHAPAVHDTLAAAVRKAMALAEPPRPPPMKGQLPPLGTPPVAKAKAKPPAPAPLAALKSKRLKKVSGITKVDLDFFDRLELARLAEVIIDVQAEGCVAAITTLYKVAPNAINHSYVAYGKLRLAGFFAAMGLDKNGRRAKESSSAAAGKVPAQLKGLPNGPNKGGIDEGDLQKLMEAKMLAQIHESARGISSAAAVADKAAATSTPGCAEYATRVLLSP